MLQWFELSTERIPKSVIPRLVHMRHHPQRTTLKTCHDGSNGVAITTCERDRRSSHFGFIHFAKTPILGLSMFRRTCPALRRVRKISRFTVSIRPQRRFPYLGSQQET